MRARKFLLFAGIVVVGVIAARILGVWVGGNLASSKTAPQVSASPFTFVAEDLTFGPIPESQEITRELRLTITSDAPATLARFETSCSCLGIEPDSDVPFQPGETKAFRIRLKGSIPDGKTLAADGLFAETVDVAAVLADGDGKPRRTPATVRATARFGPAVVRAGVVSHRETLTVKATLILYPPTAGVRVTPHPDWTVTVTGEGSNREITATATRSDVPRVVDEEIHLTPVDADGANKPVRSLRIVGEIKPDIGACPADLPLGRVPVGKTVEESFRLASLTGRRFTVRATETDSPHVTVTADPADPLTFTARITVAVLGERVQTVRVKVEQDDGRELTASVPIRYLGED